MKLRRFTKEDWYGWGGATSFPNGDQPLIGTVRYRPLATGPVVDAIVIVSGEEPGCLEIDSAEIEEDGLEEEFWAAKGALALSAMASMATFPEDHIWSPEHLRQIGFERIN